MKNDPFLIDVDVRNRLVLKYYKLVCKWVIGFWNTSPFLKKCLTLEDATQIGLMAFMRALERCRGCIEVTDDNVCLRDGEYKIPQQMSFFKKSVYLSVKRAAMGERLVHIPSYLLCKLDHLQQSWPADPCGLGDYDAIFWDRDPDVERTECLVAYILENLTEGERELVSDYYGLGGRASLIQSEIARKHGVSRCTITTRLCKIRDKIRLLVLS